MMGTALWPLLVLVGILGLAIGSFLNVVIHRVPREMSVMRPGSHCPMCNTAIKARHNVPLFGWLMLRGRCAACRTHIPARYPLVEGGTALLMVALTARIGFAPDLPAYLVFAAVLVTLLMIDADLRIVPDVIVDPAFVIAGLMLLPAAAAQNDWRRIVAAGLGLAAFATIAAVGRRIYPHLVTTGEIKLAGLLGLFLGWLSWQAVVVGVVAGVVVVGAARLTSFVARVHGGNLAVVVGPSMIAGAASALFLTVPLVSWSGALVGAL